MKKMAIIGTDKRLVTLQEAVVKQLDASLFSTMIWSRGLQEQLEELQPEIIFLPIQQLKTDIPIRFPDSCKTLFVGKKYQEIEDELNKDGRQIHFYLEDEEWIWDNANLTAEGFIHYFYLNEKQAIYNKEFIITGYGRVGKRLAFALQQLGAKVVISVRSEHQLYEAKSYGFQFETLDRLMEKGEQRETYLINTIPSRWLSSNQAQAFQAVFDLASNPGCLLETEKTPPNYHLTTSLPGMYFPKDAGQLIARAVLKHLAL